MEQDEGLQLLGNVSPVIKAVLDNSPGGEALQRSVVYGLDDVPGQLFFVQQVAGGLLEGIGAVKVGPTRNQQVHDVGVTVGSCYVKRAGELTYIIESLYNDTT